MKKILSVILTAVMAISAAALFAACSKDSGGESNNGSAQQSDLAYIKKKGTLVVGMTLFAPMDYYADENESELTGFEVEFGKAVAEKLGVNIEFQQINWEAKENELNAKNIDCLWNGFTIDDDRLATMEITDPYMNNKQVLITKAENADLYKTAGSLNGKTVVAEKESAGEGVAQTSDFFDGCNYTAVDSMAKAMMEVKSGTADAAVIDYVTGIGSLGEGTDYEDIVIVDGVDFADEQYGIAFRKGSDVPAEINKIRKELLADGTLQKIAEKYKLSEQLITE